ncbi:ribosome maturation factor RimM [Pseudanabaena sp. PCC 6802]|uniref:ribosome maturation factor RimM n=1 Tax=Pseudanabaena sp. PCC 6802 TaxID=118173 RepID=UPI000348F9F3|nr:ribosome maturation factor RimM [Pseudanabaena sp. PCC 6802]
MQDDWIVIGKVVAAHGIKGEVRVISYSDFPERFEVPGKRWLSASDRDAPQPVEMLSGRCLPGKTNVYVLRLEGIGDRTAADALRNCSIVVPQSDRPHLEPDEYYVNDLIGCRVFHQLTGKYLGEVSDVIPAGNDLLEVKKEGKTALIPFVEAIAPFVDLAQKRIEVVPPSGLVDELLV